MTDSHERSFRERIAERPGPAVGWFVGVLILLALEVGAVIQFVLSLLPGKPLKNNYLSDIPTLLSRHLVPNMGYHTPGGWQSTFLGLPPAYAWAIRLVAVYVYVFVVLLWLWFGYQLYRRHYRTADWTPRDDMVDRLSRHRWGQFGLVIVVAFIAMAIFAPTLGPTTVDQNIANPYGHKIQYYDDSAQTVTNISAGSANLQARSRGSPENNVGPMSYDDYGRFHPFGTLPTGKDLFTFIVNGARVSLFIGLLSIGGSGVIAALLAMLTAYYKGLVDLVTVVAGDSVMSMPRLMIVILLSFVAGNTWVAKIYSGGFLLALIFAATGWPYLWRSIRGPAFQISNREWVDAARSFGQRPSIIMRKHMFPYVIGYLLVYGSMTFGGIIISVAGLSFLGLGVTAPTPEWGRAINLGQSYVATVSWHIAFIPGILIVLVVVGFNAFGDGIRDALDPQSEGNEGGSEEAAIAGSGGA